MNINNGSLISQQGPIAEKSQDAETRPDHQPDALNNFEFLTFTDFQQTIDPQTKKKVRSHSMHWVHRTTRVGERSKKKGVVVLDTSSLFNEPPAPDPEQALVALQGTYNIGAGRSDPFADYPIAMNMRTQYLFDHCKHQV